MLADIHNSLLVLELSKITFQFYKNFSLPLFSPSFNKKFYILNYNTMYIEKQYIEKNSNIDLQD